MPGSLFLCVSGLTWSLVAGENIGDLRKQLDWMPTEVTTSAQGPAGKEDPHAGHEGHENHAHHGGEISSADTNNPIDCVATSACSAGLTGKIELTPPAEGDNYWKAAEVRQPYKLHNDAVAVEPANGQIMDKVPFSSWAFAAQLTSWAIQLHMGILFGIFTEIVLRYSQ